jgi:hypothetical protein
MRNPTSQPAAEALAQTHAPAFPPLQLESRPAVTTEQAAYYLNRRPQTLRIWAMREHGPLRPKRINGRLAWPVAELKRVLGVA